MKVRLVILQIDFAFDAGFGYVYTLAIYIVRNGIYQSIIGMDLCCIHHSTTVLMAQDIWLTTLKIGGTHSNHMHQVQHCLVAVSTQKELLLSFLSFNLSTTTGHQEGSPQHNAQHRTNHSGMLSRR